MESFESVLSKVIRDWNWERERKRMWWVFSWMEVRYHYHYHSAIITCLILQFTLYLNSFTCIFYYHLIFQPYGYECTDFVLTSFSIFGFSKIGLLPTKN